MRKHDVIIVGAGPIGSYTAYLLAKKGFDVLILEKNGSVAYSPACTGIIGAEAFERFKLRQDSILSSVKDIVLCSPSGLKLAFRPGSTQAFVVDRIKFDQNLREAALKNGASISFGTPCQEIQIKGEHVEVRVNDHRENIKAKAVIISTGFNKRLLERLGFGSPSDYIHGVQTEVKMDGETAVRIYVGKKIAPGSFAWVVRLGNGRARIGLTTKDHPSIFLKRFLESHHLRDKIEEQGMILNKIIPVGTLKRTYSERMLVVGEAAGLMKTTTHGGIYYGLISARLAAETLTEAFDIGNFGASIMEKYEKRWRDMLGTEIKIGHRLRRFFSSLQDWQIDGFFKIAMSDGIMDLVHKKVKFDWHNDLIFSLVKHSLIKNYFFKRKII